MASALDGEPLSLQIEHPDLVHREIGILLVEQPGLIQPAEFCSSLRRIQQISGPVVKQLILQRFFFEIFPLFMFFLLRV